MKRPLSFSILAAFTLSILLFPLPSFSGPAPAGLELYVSPDRTFALYRPPGWLVKTQHYPNGWTVGVAAPSGPTFIQMTFLTTPDQTNDSIRFASQTIKNIRAYIPGLKVAWAKTTQDRRRTVVEDEYQRPDGTAIRGRQYFIMNYPEARGIGYETEAARFNELQPLLLSILANLTILDPEQFKAAPAAGPAPINLALSPRRLPDGSASLLVPQGWDLLGAKGAALIKSPDGAAGFAFSKGDFLGPSSLPYFNSANIPGLHYPYMAPVDALMTLMGHLGSSRFQVLERAPDPARAAAAAAAVRRGADAETALLTFTNDRGLACQGYFEVLGFRPLPSGQWGILFHGVWAPADRFQSFLPDLIRMSESFRINEQWAAEYIRQGVANLKRQMAKTSRMMAETATAARESLTASFQERARSQDYLDYKRTSVIRGEQEWVSQVEGGALYKSDHWGLSREGERIAEGQPFNYYNYQGQNPRYNESMTPVDASREVFERVYGAGR